jgi:hypothetical protein
VLLLQLLALHKQHPLLYNLLVSPTAFPSAASHPVGSM